MRGKGKAKDFTTVGKEHMRREAIFRCKDAFLQSDRFQNALKAGLKHLSREQGPDSSSPYSREEHRRFLATLSDEDRHVLEASEGLGNSQKAEVAWLERNGFTYIEKEVGELKEVEELESSSCPSLKAIWVGSIPAFDFWLLLNGKGVYSQLRQILVSLPNGKGGPTPAC